MEEKQYSCLPDGEKGPNSTLVLAFKEGGCLKSLALSHVLSCIVVHKYSMKLSVLFVKWTLRNERKVQCELF